jgi:di/tripeptidase
MTNEQIQKLISYCLPKQMALKAILTEELTARGREIVLNHGFLYTPGTHPVLLVAHMDTVHAKMPTKKDIAAASTEEILRCKQGIGGDDRCGIYIIMEIIKQLDCHVLFCEDEEEGRKGAGKFCETDIRPDVQFIVEFDRKDHDHAVFYGCQNEDFIGFVTSFGYRKEYGTYSDISDIAPHLGIAAVNLSSGYYNAHGTDEYIRLDDIEPIIERAIPLIADISKQYKYIESYGNSRL